ncbi:MAG TPA: lactate permease LctP family transporter [Candidatus Solibacter sp.]|nr:lactate permease LctP family transporter [Candidatus Solibacter sp.]
MTTWTQVYDPLHHWQLSTLVASLPVVVLLGLLAGLKVRVHLCAIAGAATAILCAIRVFHMPSSLAFTSFLYGSAYGLLKIVWIVIAAVFLYDISVETGQFEIMKQSVAAITPDRRLQLLLVAFCFGAFIEGCAGFGAPVAIAGAFMIGLGFKPFQAAALNLIANTAPVAFGAIGIPIHALIGVTGLPESDVTAMIGRILPITAVILPFWLVRAMVSWSETIEVLPAILVVGISFAGTQFFWSNFMDSNLVDIASGIVSLVATLLFLRVWQPKRIWRFPEEREADAAIAAAAKASSTPSTHIPVTDTMGDEWQIRQKSLAGRRYSAAQVARAWLPFAILSIFVLCWGIPTFKNAMGKATTPAFASGGWEVPYLHKAVYRAQPVVAQPTAEAARFDFNWLTATGSACFLAALLSGFLLGLKPPKLLQIFGRTLFRLRFAILAMTCMLGLGFVTRYSGMDAVLGLAFTRTGWFFPFFGAFIGWLGVALTGSDTSSNVLFGGLQKITAQQLGLSPVLMAATNSAGGVMGKMIDAQSITIATAATNQVGQEGSIFRFVFWHSVSLAAIVGVIVMLYAYVAPQLIPHGLTFIH